MDKEVKKSRKLFWIVLIILIAIIIFFSTRIYLTVNLLLGNDIVVQLGSDSDVLSLKHGESGKIKFNAYMLTNPFCKAACISTFTDLSRQNIIEKDNFTLVPAISKLKEYTLTASKLGKGQDYYRFDLSCKGIETFWCRTSNQSKTRSILITMNYDLNDDEQKYKNDSKSEIEQLIQKASELRQKINYVYSFSSNLSSLEVLLPAEIKNESLAIETSTYDLKRLWESGYYDILPESLAQSKDSVAMLETKFNETDMILTNNVSGYNPLIDNLTVLKQKLEQWNQINVTNETLINLNNAIDDFNSAISNFSKKNSLPAKEDIISNISSEISGLQILSDENSTVSSSKNISSLPEKIILTQPSINPLSLTFSEPSPVCCLFGNCSACCIDSNCGEKDYPIVLLHGHAFNKGISAEYSLETFQEIQAKLEAENYLNAGSVLISPPEEKNIWSQINVPVTVRASYYFDLYLNPAENSIIQTKSDSLDTYALRLKEIIDTVKYKTGKSKVTIVAHSMGGLVARKYMDIFGSGSVDKLIMIATPNHGVESSFCPVFGEALECRDMSADSLFLNKLNHALIPSIPIYNIIGEGCSMNNQTGDGIVTEDSALLEGATNIKVTGSCDELKLQYFHNNMIDPSQYPEVYQEIKEALKEK
jgi:pimeloyl-ACP methyl ester carboxylesterase